MALQLRMIESRVCMDPALAEEALKSAGDERFRSLEELRELVRGLHPAVLNHGLAPALARISLAPRWLLAVEFAHKHVSVRVGADDPRFK